MLKRGVTKQVVVKRALKRVTSQELSSDLIEILHLKTGLEDEKILKRHAAFLGLQIFYFGHHNFLVLVSNEIYINKGVCSSVSNC